MKRFEITEEDREAILILINNRAMIKVKNYLNNLETPKTLDDFAEKLKEEYLKLGTRVLNNKSDQDVLDLIDRLLQRSKKR